MARFIALLLTFCLFAQAALGATDAIYTSLSSYDQTGVPNDTLSFVIQARDESNQPMTSGGAIFTAEVDNGGFINGIVDNGDGTYSGSWVPPTVGTYHLTIILIFPAPAGEIAGSPYSIIVTVSSATTTFSATRSRSVSVTNTRQGCSGGSPSLLSSYATGEGVEGVPCCVDYTVNFTITARDLWGNPICHGGDDFSVKVIKPNLQTASHSIMDNQDGTYFVEYTPNMDGLWIISIRLGAFIKLPPYIVYHDVC